MLIKNTHIYFMGSATPSIIIRTEHSKGFRLKESGTKLRVCIIEILFEQIQNDPGG